MFLPLKDNIPKFGLPVVTIMLIVINCAVFLMFEGSETQAYKTISSYAAVSFELTHHDKKCVTPLQGANPQPDCGSRAEMARKYNTSFPPWWITVITSMFLHGGVLHLVGNMIFLFTFGWALEGALGGARFLGLYLVAGIVGTAAQTFFDPMVQYPGLGASGAIAGVMGAYFMNFPRAKMTSLFLGFFPCEPRAVWVLLTWLISNLVILRELQQTGFNGGTAVFVHLGAFATGAALTMLLLSREQIDENRLIAEFAGTEDDMPQLNADGTPVVPEPTPVFKTGRALTHVAVPVNTHVAVPGGPQFYKGGTQAVASVTPAGYFVPPNGHFVPPVPYAYAPPPHAVAPPRDPFAPPPPPPG